MVGDLIGYSDSDWAGDLDDRKSVSGYMFKLCGAPISWRSKNQTSVALSTAEAEYVALFIATQEAVWLKQLLFELRIEQSKPTVIYEDNQSAIFRWHRMLSFTEGQNISTCIIIMSERR